jgi:AraC-like DNA-binding protein
MADANGRLGAGSMFLSRPTEVYSYSHVKYAEPDTCLRVEFSGPVADDLRRSVFRLPLVLPTTNRLSFLRLRISSLLANAAEMSLDVLACEVVDAAANAEHDRHRLYRSEQLRWYAERVGAARELMDCDPTTNRSLSHLSSQVGMSVFLFARVFREQTRTMSPELRQKRANATNRRRSSMSAPARCPCAQTQSIPGRE